MSDSIHYINKKGKCVKLEITSHARHRFSLRWSLMFPEKDLPIESIDQEIARWFHNSNRVKNLSHQDKRRLKRYGNDTLFFRTNAFTFVVQGAKIVTIEISDRNQRILNKRTRSLSKIPAITQTTLEERKEIILPPPSKLKISAAALDTENKIKHVSLGTYQAVKIEDLHLNNVFREEIKQRFVAKRPMWALRAIYAKEMNGEQIQII